MSDPPNESAPDQPQSNAPSDPAPLPGVGGDGDPLPPDAMAVSPSDAPAALIPNSESAPTHVPELVHTSHSDRWAHRRAEPRPLAFFWTTLLAIGTVVALAGTTSTGILGQDVYRPVVRSLLTVALTCACLIWPLFRLSQPAEPHRGTRVAIRDLPVVFIPLAAILVPQRLWFLAGWSTGLVVLIALAMLAWLFIIAGVLAVSLERVRTHPGNTSHARALAMLGIVILISVAPAATLLRPATSDAANPDWLMLASPLTCVATLTQDRPWSGLASRVDPRQWLGLCMLSAAAVAAWVRAAWISRGLPSPEYEVARPMPPA